MKNKIMLIVTIGGLAIGGLTYGFSFQSCPMEGTAACPKINCPLAGTPDCPYDNTTTTTKLPVCCMKK